MKVEYMGGCFSPGDFIEHALPEAAFIGRSNVGKSSLINSLAKKRQLARVSSTPGRTQAIHYFGLSGAYCLVDLPGYGFAKAPKSVRSQWGPLVGTYISDSPNLRLGLLLVDIRRDPREDEHNIITRFRERGTPLLLIVTKTDKLAKSRRTGRLQQLASQLKVPQDRVLGYSSLKGDGRTELFNRLRDELSAS